MRLLQYFTCIVRNTCTGMYLNIDLRNIAHENYVIVYRAVKSVGPDCESNQFKKFRT